MQRESNIIGAFRTCMIPYLYVTATAAMAFMKDPRDKKTELHRSNRGQVGRDEVIHGEKDVSRIEEKTVSSSEHANKKCTRSVI